MLAHIAPTQLQVAHMQIRGQTLQYASIDGHAGMTYYDPPMDLHDCCSWIKGKPIMPTGVTDDRFFKRVIMHENMPLVVICATCGHATNSSCIHEKSAVKSPITTTQSSVTSHDSAATVLVIHCPEDECECNSAGRSEDNYEEGSREEDEQEAVEINMPEQIIVSRPNTESSSVETSVITGVLTRAAARRVSSSPTVGAVSATSPHGRPQKPRATSFSEPKSPRPVSPALSASAIMITPPVVTIVDLEQQQQEQRPQKQQQQQQQQEPSPQQQHDQPEKQQKPEQQQAQKEQEKQQQQQKSPIVVINVEDTQTIRNLLGLNTPAPDKMQPATTTNEVTLPAKVPEIVEMELSTPMAQTQENRQPAPVNEAIPENTSVPMDTTPAMSKCADWVNTSPTVPQMQYNNAWQTSNQPPPRATAAQQMVTTAATSYTDYNPSASYTGARRQAAEYNQQYNQSQYHPQQVHMQHQHQQHLQHPQQAASTQPTWQQHHQNYQGLNHLVQQQQQQYYLQQHYPTVSPAHTAYYHHQQQPAIGLSYPQQQHHSMPQQQQQQYSGGRQHPNVYSPSVHPPTVSHSCPHLTPLSTAPLLPLPGSQDYFAANTLEEFLTNMST
jgi:hypothetical protein